MLYRMVNGKRVKLTAAEEAQFKADSAAQWDADNTPLVLWQREIAATENANLFRFLEELLTARGTLTDLSQELQDWHAGRAAIRLRKP